MLNVRSKMVIRHCCIPNNEHERGHRAPCDVLLMMNYRDIRSKKDIKGGKAQKIYTITGKGKMVVKNRDLLIKRMAIEMKRMLKEEFNE